MYNLIKDWKDEDNRRWYLTDADDYPYVSATSVVAIAKAYRYSRDDLNDEEGEDNRIPKDDKSKGNLIRAGKEGTDIHSVLEALNRISIGEHIAPDNKLIYKYKDIIAHVQEQVRLIELNEGKVIVKEVERQCINPIYKYAGRFDVLVTVNNKYEIWDYKTSKSIHEEDGWQLVAYMESLKLEGIDVERVRIIHIDKRSTKVEVLKYQHHEYMFNKFLSCIELFKGIYFNDLLKGRINDIQELGKKYKWPLEELTKNYVLCYNLSKGDKNMELSEVTGLGDGKSFTRDPNRVDFNEPVVGVILGNVPNRWVHKVGKDKTYACPGKATCERCKLGMKKSIQFMANFLTIDDKDKAVIKKIESESTRLFFALSDAFKRIKDEGGDPKTAVLRIERTGKSFDTQYKVENVAPKHKALKDIATTIKPLTPFTLEFKATTIDSVTTNTVDRTDIVEA